MSAPMSLVWVLDIIGSSLLIVLSIYALQVMFKVYRIKRDITLYSYLFAQTVARRICRFSRWMCRRTRLSSA